jgi:hypothetical protein
VTDARIRGELRWFNEVTQRGLIRTSEGDFEVLGSGFAEGQIPVGRCAGTQVEFEVEVEGEGEGDGTQPRAVRVSVVDFAVGGRARRRSRG